MKAVLFLSIFCCIFVVTNAVECYVNDYGKEPRKVSGCYACYFQYTKIYTPSSIQRRCLIDEIASEMTSQIITVFDKCFVLSYKIGQEASQCLTDLCNINCAGKSFPTPTEKPSSSSSSSTTLPSTPSSSINHSISNDKVFIKSSNKNLSTNTNNCSKNNNSKN